MPTSTPHKRWRRRPVQVLAACARSAVEPPRDWHATNAGNQRHLPAAVSAVRSHHKPTLAPPRRPHSDRPPSSLPRGAKPASCRRRRWPPLARAAPATLPTGAAPSAATGSAHHPAACLTTTAVTPRWSPQPALSKKRAPTARPHRPPPTSTAEASRQAAPPMANATVHTGGRRAAVPPQKERRPPPKPVDGATAPHPCRRCPPPPPSQGSVGAATTSSGGRVRPCRGEPRTRAVAGRRPARAAAVAVSRGNHSPPVPSRRHPSVGTCSRGQRQTATAAHRRWRVPPRAEAGRQTRRQWTSRLAPTHHDRKLKQGKINPKPTEHTETATNS